MKQQKIQQLIIDKIISIKKPKSHFVVGINGVDGSGKSSFSYGLKKHLEKNGNEVVCISIDDFHNPKNIRYSLGELSPEGFYQKSINYVEFINHVLSPLSKIVAYPFSIATKSFCLASDAPRFCKQDISENTIVLIEGIFLFRPELIHFLDYKIYIEADFGTTFTRMVERDLPAHKTQADIDNYTQRFTKKYKAGQQLYLKEVRPKLSAGLIIDNNDYQAPKLMLN